MTIMAPPGYAAKDAIEAPLALRFERFFCSLYGRTRERADRWLVYKTNGDEYVKLLHFHFILHSLVNGKR